MKIAVHFQYTGQTQYMQSLNNAVVLTVITSFITKLFMCFVFGSCV